MLAFAYAYAIAANVDTRLCLYGHTPKVRQNSAGEPKAGVGDSAIADFRKRCRSAHGVSDGDDVKVRLRIPPQRRHCGALRQALQRPRGVQPLGGVQDADPHCGAGSAARRCDKALQGDQKDHAALNITVLLTRLGKSRSFLAAVGAGSDLF